MNFTQSAPLARALAVLWAAIMVGAIMLVALYVLQIRTDGHLPLFYAIYLTVGFVSGVINSEYDYRKRYLPRRMDHMPIIPNFYSTEIVRWTYTWFPALVLFVLFKVLIRVIGPPVRRRT